MCLLKIILNKWKTTIKSFKKKKSNQSLIYVVNINIIKQINKI